MFNALENKFGRGPVALSIPLLGLVVMWLLTILGMLSDLYTNYGVYWDNYALQQELFHLSTYLFLAGVTILGFSAVVARHMAHSLTSNRWESAIRGFTLVAVIAALIICTIFGVGIFMSNFMRVSVGSGQPAPNELMRIVNVYIPIVLDAAVMVFLILRAFVNKVEEPEDD